MAGEQPPPITRAQFDAAWERLRMRAGNRATLEQAVRLLRAYVDQQDARIRALEQAAAGAVND